MSVYFIGIGGIAVSALAKYFLSKGEKISGSDLVSSETTEELGRWGLKISIGKHKKSNVPKNATRVIYSPAVPKNNLELKIARKRKLKIQSYPEAVGEITRNYKTITVSGSHGKSTTTALAALALEEAYFDPTVIVGTKIKEFDNSNFRKGMGTYFVLEADEWNKSFLNYAPFIAIVTNIDIEHLDTYKNAKTIENTFEKYLEKVPKDGAVIANKDDKRLRQIAKKLGKKVKWYSLEDKEAYLVRQVLQIPGEHNVSNALAVVRLGKILGISLQDTLRALHRFTGAWRRFELRGIVNGAFIFTDYGHHPTEIKATIQAARDKFPMRRIWCVYQPHQYQRLAYLWKDFLSAFDLADTICLLPVYDVAGRETKTAKTKVNSLKLSKEILKRGKNVEYLKSFANAKIFITNHARPGDIVLIMGAGDIYELVRNFDIV